jgi:penicillin-insensitive murein endopeptidase
MASAATLACAVLLVVGVAALSGCLGVFAGDTSSLSLGSHARGALVHGTAMPFEGTGYRVPKDWRSRDHRYGTEEMVEWLTALFTGLAKADPESAIYLGDISARQGGDAAKHRSHASGRDVDIFFVASDGQGHVLRDLPAMLHFDSGGRAVRWSPAQQGRWTRAPVPDAHFDARRNWAIVRAMVSSQTVEVQWIFIHGSLAALLLAEAEREGTPALILDKARALLHQPTDAQPHDDHMHVRIFCTPADRVFGCMDKGPKRWLKKHWKYMSSLERAPGAMP